MGSKSRIAKEILLIILRTRKEGQWYIEPFMGGCNVIKKVSGNRIANDINPYLVACSEALSNGWLPPKHISENVYNDIKSNKDNYEKCLVGYVGFQLSYGAKWFDTYRKDKVGRRDYSLEAYEHIQKQARWLKGIKFYNLNYYDLLLPSKSLIYCDPPYQNTIKYKANEDKFDHNKFWQWCRDCSNNGHTVLISEYTAPDDFECIWSKEIYNSLTMSSDKGAQKVTEKLFRYKSSIDNTSDIYTFNF